MSYIYIVGKPDTRSSVFDIVRARGHKLGLLQDTKSNKDYSRLFDRVELVDFANLSDEMPRLAGLDLDITGLLCTYENYIISKARLGQFFSVASLSVEAAKLSTDKALMRQALLDYDPSISPQFKLIESLNQALNFASSAGYPLIIKPANLVKSLLVMKCNNEAELIGNYNYAKKEIINLYQKYAVYESEPRIIIEEFVTGHQCSVAAFVSSNGEPHFCEGIVDLVTAQDLGWDDNFLYKRMLPMEISEALSQEIFKVAEAGIRALKMTSVPAHVELMCSDKGVKIIEIGARIGGYRPRMFELSYSLDLASQELNLAIDKPINLNGDFKAYSAVYELFPDQEGTMVGIKGDYNSADFEYFSQKFQTGQMVGPAKNGYKAVAIIIVKSEDKAKFQALCNVVEALSIEVGI